MKNTPIGKLIAVFLSILLCFGLLFSCEGTNTPVDNNPENIRPDEDPTYNWADWIQPEEIPYEAPESGITINKLQMISIGPGADCSTEMTINWHSYEPVNYVEYTMASDTGFAKSRKIWVKAELTKGTFTAADGKVYGWNDGSGTNDNTKFYVCKADLTKLKSNTNYIYRVGTTGPNAKKSETRKFKTASAIGSPFSFFWAADLHTPSSSSTYTKNITDLINYSNENLTKGGLPKIDFALFTGDLVDEGGKYKDWQYWDSIEALKNYMFATIVGNHDYYWYDGYRINGDKPRVSNRWQLECTAYPATNTYTVSGVEKKLPASNYWFLYNKVLFIGVDSLAGEAIDPDAQASVSAQKSWFKAVVAQNKGKFDYLIAHQHYACIINDEIIDWGPFDDWRSTYETCLVDFALGSDQHEYSRTYEVRGSNQTPVKEGGKPGVVYVASPQTEGTISGVTYRSDTTKPAEFYGGGCVAGAYFVVNSDTITLNVVGMNGTIYDTKTIKKKTRE